MMAEPIIFTLLLGHKDQILEKVEDQLTIISVQTNKETEIPDKDRIFAEILEQSSKQNKIPIFNIQLDSNNTQPIFKLQDVINLQNLNIKSTITFDHYNSLTENPKLATYWQELIKKVDHVFFVNEQDRELAIKENLISREKTTTIKDTGIDSVISVFNNLAEDQKANILISSAIPDSKKLDTIIQKTKNQNGRVIIKTWPLSLDEATSLVAAKFGITSEDQIYGLKLEINEILQDRANAAHNLQKYVSQISRQFQKDLGKAEINPIDFNFDREQVMKNIYDDKPINQVKEQVKSYELPKEKQSEQPGFFKKVFNYFKDTIKAIFGKKEAVPNLSVPTKQEADPTIPSTPQEAISQFHSPELEEIKKNSAKIAISPQPQQTINNAEFSLELNTSDVDDVKKPDYLYQDYQIQHILKASIDESKVSIQPAVTPVYPNIFKDILTNAINDVKTGKEASVIPIETGGEHWVGMSVSYNKKDDTLIFTYNDPMGNPIDNRPELQKLIKETAPNNVIIDLQIKQQENEYDCGVFVCDNLTKLAKGQEILSTEQSKDKKGLELRNDQAKTLSNVMVKQQALKAKPQSVKFQESVKRQSLKDTSTSRHL